MKPGDKSYGAVEYSPNFFKIDSAVPKVQFGASRKPYLVENNCYLFIRLCNYVESSK
ncbi:unnamed protein product [Trichobilharzia regenti]|nr:unnamed protein product [Trichobilharzia regenti]